MQAAPDVLGLLFTSRCPVLSIALFHGDRKQIFEEFFIPNGGIYDLMTHTECFTVGVEMLLNMTRKNTNHYIL